MRKRPVDRAILNEQARTQYLNRQGGEYKLTMKRIQAGQPVHCKDCNVLLTSENSTAYNGKARTSATKRRCDVCRRKRGLQFQDKWHKAHPGQRTAYARKHSTGWTPEAFAAAWVAQEGKCACCGRPMRPDGQYSDSVNADHDHKTKKPRALVCGHCNKMIGHYEVVRADPAAYLSRFEN